jgi:DNA-binding MarR family transcriptional regulator
MTTRQLAAHCLVSAGAISQRLARAEAHGWVTRTRAPGRVVKVQLTDEGKDMADRIAGSIFQTDDELLAVLPHKDRQELTRLLKTLTLAIGGDAQAFLPRVGPDYRAPQPGARGTLP